CLRKDILYENIEPVVKSTYANGEIVKLVCIIGYSGFYKLRYEMASRFNERHCTINGWDNRIPVCEEVRCPVIHTNKDVTAFGQTGEASFGDVVEFKCASPDKNLNGHRTIHCTPNGYWSAPVPQCTVCFQTDINYENIDQVKQTSYADGHMLNVKCQMGFTGGYTLKCAKGEWKTVGVQRPCAKLKCGHPGNVTNADITPHTSEYTFGVTVVYTCQRGYKLTEITFTVPPIPNGEGDHPAEVYKKEITCETPRDQHVHSVYFWRTMKLYERQHYSCENGYKPIAVRGLATCTPAGLMPDPLCVVVTCQLKLTPGIKTIRPEGKTIFKVDESVEITCSSKLWTPFIRYGSTTSTCQSDGRWDQEPVCEETCELSITDSGAVRTIPERKTVFIVGEKVGLVCPYKDIQKIETFTCTNTGKWDYHPTCEEIKCQTPHGQHVFLPELHFRGETAIGRKRMYNCESGFQKMAEEATCTRNGWSPNPLCAEIMCQPPRLPNADIIADGTCQEQELKNVQIIDGDPSLSSPYTPGQVLIFKCTDNNMRFYGQRAIECGPDGRWNYPYPHCGGSIHCPLLTKNLRFVTVPEMKSIYRNSETLEYRCNEPYNVILAGVLMCQNGRWNGTYDCTSDICPPPPFIYNGDFSINTSRVDGIITAVSYSCQFLFELSKKQETFKCVDGMWENPPKCLRPCEIDAVVEKYNLQLPEEKVYVKHSETYKLNCQDGWNSRGLMNQVVVSCSDGNLEIDQSYVHEDEQMCCCRFKRLSFYRADCDTGNLNHENTDQVPPTSHADGQLLKLSCRMGFTGSLKFKCVKGEWKPVGAQRPCAKKKCGPPEEVSNAEFILQDETEFVFGARVVYTCNTGYEISGRVNQRTCRMEGWDNLPPVCEKKKCPPIETKPGVRATGNTEEGTYGDVVSFECDSQENTINGKKQIECTDMGEWSAPFPTCNEISCRAPPIPNGEAENPNKVYKKGEQLRYQCQSGYKPREGTPRCAAYGWTMNPECEVVTCEIKSHFGVEGISPDRVFFRARERVDIICSQEHWFSSTKQRTGFSTCRDDGQWDREPECRVVTCELKLTDGIKSADPGGKTVFKVDESVVIKCFSNSWNPFIRFGSTTSTCQSNGQWDQEPVCELITCAPPKDRSISNVHLWETMKVDEIKSYSCEPGYIPNGERAEATCTQDGLIPKPLCVEVKCEFRPNSEVEVFKPARKIDFRVGDTVEITCTSNSWIPSSKKNKETFTCQANGQWDKEPVCKAKETPCTVPNFEHGFFKWDSSKKNFFYSCDTDYKPFFGEKWWSSVTCDQGTWSHEPQCISKMNCGALPSIQNGKFEGNDNPTLKCDRGFKQSGGPIECIDGNWVSPPSCTVEKTCGDPPSVTDAVIMSEPKELYIDGDEVTYACRSPFVIYGESKVTCNKQGWTDQPTCELVTCEIKSHFGVEGISPDRTFFRVGERVDITCTEEHWFSSTKQRTGFSTCRDDGQWDREPECREITCEPPRDQHAYSDYIWRTMNLNERKRYHCQDGYKPFKEEAVATCTAAGLMPKPLCLGVTCELKLTPGIKTAKPEGKTVFRVDESVLITCLSNSWNPFIRHGSTISKCRSDGLWSLEPICEAKMNCGALPSIQNGKFEGNDNPTLKCDRGFKQSGGPIECIEGNWVSPPSCTVKKTCGDPPSVTDAVIMSEPKELYIDGDEVTYACRSPFVIYGESKVTCNKQGWTVQPTCEPKETPCTVPNLEHGFFNWDSSKKTGFYSCDTDYKPFFGEKWWSSVTCDQGTWSHEPQCISKMNCGALPSIQNGKFEGNDNPTLKCDRGFKQSGGPIECIEVCFQTDINYENIDQVKQTSYADGHMLNVKCQMGFTGGYTLKCAKGEWKTVGVQHPCAIVSCPCIKTNPGVRATVNTKNGTYSDVTSFECVSTGNTKNGTYVVTCELKLTDGIKSADPDGKTVFRVVITCAPPKDRSISNVHLWKTMKVDEIKSYSCEPGYIPNGERAEATCTQDGLIPKPLCVDVHEDEQMCCCRFKRLSFCRAVMKVAAPFQNKSCCSTF
ncbi:hypothetical protein DNTS_014278, partial [Danionella cerebrum]